MPVEPPKLLIVPATGRFLGGKVLKAVDLTIRRSLAVAMIATCALVVVASPASANHYHTSCVGHGFVHGSSTTDNSWHSGGCGNSGKKSCLVRMEGATYYASYVGTGNPATCNQWSNYCCGELAGYATVDFDGVFSSHSHSAH